jgi:hypothetical protein
MSTIITKMQILLSVEDPFSTFLSQHTSLPPFSLHGQTTPSHSVPSHYAAATPCRHLSISPFTSSLITLPYHSTSATFEV